VRIPSRATHLRFRPCPQKSIHRLPAYRFAPSAALWNACLAGYFAPSLVYACIVRRWDMLVKRNYIDSQVRNR